MEIALERIRNWVPGTRLDLFYLQLTSLPVLPNTLTILTCSCNSLTSLPTLPDTLTELHCCENELTSLPTLPDTLKVLNCSENKLTLLPTLPDTLECLNCWNNQLTSLPSLPVTLTWLSSYGNKIPTRMFGEGIPDFSKRICVWEAEESRMRIQTATGQIKEELMMNRWSPARIDAQLALGLNLEDM